MRTPETELADGLAALRADVRRLEARLDAIADVIRRWLGKENSVASWNL